MHETSNRQSFVLNRFLEIMFHESEFEMSVFFDSVAAERVQRVFGFSSQVQCLFQIEGK